MRRRGQGSTAERSVSRWGPLHWLGVALLLPVLCFVATALFVSRWEATIDADALSIAQNGAPGIVSLSNAREDIRYIWRRVAEAQPSSLAADRAAIAVLTANFDATLKAYRQTEDYPGEREAYEVTSQRRAAYFAAVADALGHRGDDPAAREAALGRVTSASDALIESIRALMLLNAAEVSTAGAEITMLHHRSVVLADVRDVLAFFLAIGGSLMGLRGARQQLAAVQERSRLHESRADELDIVAGRIAHDLKNPLSAILMRCAVAARSPKPEAPREALDKIAHQTRRMGEIIDALLVFARSGGRPEPGGVCQIEAVVHEIVTEAQPFAAEARIELVIAPVCSGRVACDPSVLAVVLSNLVRNAIKYMGEGGDARRITVRSEAHGAEARLSVEDTGPGLPPGTEGKVFEPFVRLTSGEGSASGFGLGLATVKRLVEAHQGRVGVEVGRAGGCRFWFTLPRSAAPGDAM